MIGHDAGRHGGGKQQPREPATPELPELITNSIGMKLTLVQPGTFTMGCESDEAYDDEKPVHQVTLTRPFYLGVYPVTQAEYERVIGSNPSRFKWPDRPVEQVSWNDAQALSRDHGRRRHRPLPVQDGL